MRFIRHLFLALAVTASGTLVCRAQTNADVIVYGSTPGGFCAAIGAAREGASVILPVPTDHVGGMNTGGLCFSDSDQMYRDKLMGFSMSGTCTSSRTMKAAGSRCPTT
jgi:NADPH-dependent 2,4-dienoyl-CoA reductase/sulfur reductase-like enzyme